MGSFDELIEKKLVLDTHDLNSKAALLAKDSNMKVRLGGFVCRCVHG